MRISQRNRIQSAPSPWVAILSLLLIAELCAQPLRVDYQGVPLSAVLTSIAKFADLDLIAHGNLHEKVTLYLEEAENWRAVLDNLATAFDFSYRIDDRSLEIFAPRLAEPALAVSVEPIQPLPEEPLSLPVTRTFLIHHAEAEQIVAILITLRDTTLSADQSSGIIGRWSTQFVVVADTRTNRLIAQGYGEELMHLEQLLKQIDIPRIQVRLAVHIIIANSTIARELGVRWGGRLATGNVALSGGASGATNSIDAAFGDNLFVDFGLGSDNAALFSVGFEDNNNLLDLELSALAYQRQVDIAAQPKITTLDGTAASIASGTEIPYIVENNGTDTVEFRDALLRLEVTPRVSSRERLIHLDVEVTQDSVGTVINGQPSIDTNRLVSQVTLRDGETSVLGGIKQKRVVDNADWIPWWGTLPFIGWLFRGDSESIEEGELVIFITPTIIEQP